MMTGSIFIMKIYATYAQTINKRYHILFTEKILWDNKIIICHLLHKCAHGKSLSFLDFAKNQRTRCFWRQITCVCLLFNEKFNPKEVHHAFLWRRVSKNRVHKRNLLTSYFKKRCINSGIMSKKNFKLRCNSRSR